MTQNEMKAKTIKDGIADGCRRDVIETAQESYEFFYTGDIKLSIIRHRGSYGYEQTYTNAPSSKRGIYHRPIFPRFR